MKDYADWIRKDGLQAGRPGPVVSSDWTEEMLEVAQHIEALESLVREAMTFADAVRTVRGWLSGTGWDIHKWMERARKVVPSEPIENLQSAVNRSSEPLPFWLTCSCGWSSGQCRDDCWRVKEWRANGRIAP